MKTRMVEERIGEYLGPVDWTYDFSQRGKELLRQLEQPGEWQAMTYQCWRRVLRVGMYDGWPFWKPTPSVLLAGPLWPEWATFYNLQAVERLADASAPEGATR